MRLAWPPETVPGSVALGDRDDQPTQVALVDRVAKAPVEPRVCEQRGAEITENPESRGTFVRRASTNLYQRRSCGHSLMIKSLAIHWARLANIASLIPGLICCPEERIQPVRDVPGEAAR